MFDPTAFENMKVVIEGALYDCDLEGEITIVDRNDIMNMAKLSRSYDVTFSLSNDEAVKCEFSMEAALENLAAELLPASLSERLAGTAIFITFGMTHLNNRLLHEEIDNELKTIWGNGRNIKHIMKVDPFQDADMIRKEIVIDFNRLIFEDQMDDVVEMVDYMIRSLEKINKILRRNFT